VFNRTKTFADRGQGDGRRRGYARKKTGGEVAYEKYRTLHSLWPRQIRSVGEGGKGGGMGGGMFLGSLSDRESGYRRVQVFGTLEAKHRARLLAKETLGRRGRAGGTG